MPRTLFVLAGIAGIVWSWIWGYHFGVKSTETKYQIAQIETQTEILKAKAQAEKEAAEKVTAARQVMEMANEKLKTDYDNSVATLRSYYARMLQQRKSNPANTGRAMPAASNTAGSSKQVRAENDGESAQRARENLLNLAQKCDKIIVEHNALVDAINANRNRADKAD